MNHDDKNNANRSHHYNLAFEMAILNTIIFSPETLADIMDLLKVHHFYFNPHAEIYEAILALYKKDFPIDETFIHQQLKGKHERELMEVMSINPISGIFPYINQVVEYYRKRQLRKAAIEILKMDEEEKSSEAIIGELESLIAKIDEGVSDEIHTFYDLMLHYDQNPPPPGIKTNIDFADEGVGGEWETGNLVTISGDPEAGKTIFTMQMLKEISYQEPVGMFAFEFTTRMLIKMQKKSDEKFINDISAMQNMKVISKGFDISDIERNVKKLIRKGVRTFGIDSQMRIENNSFTGFTMEERETEKFSRLAKLAQKHDVLIYLIIQTTDSAPDRPLGSKKGAHEATVMVRLKREKPKDKDDHKEVRKYIVHKNKMSGQHFENDIVLNPYTLKFSKPSKAPVTVEYQNTSGQTTRTESVAKVGEELKKMAGRNSDKINMSLL
ncbi:DnaB-like helicase N-terminal domain-containing protein [Sulfuricurvum sp.]|uniref:DnaB-like helicase N-terminal domain-containing protein n=1 Tax=Sulfuricurvum sp. TaxID=2025608 RepID=UPI002D272E18|nr:DnaB-like helicase N-terminal domain-containing protein [Sulfuricurvum sp.]HZF69388.1 DnaB-like helicase N-terminal domain-containing protein [Sulfuricurvum sp.]